MFTAFASEFGLPDETALKIAAPFGGGMARTGGTCGALTGGLMVIGLKAGYTTPDGKDETYALARDFLRRFEQRHGALLCRELIGCDLSSPAGLLEARAKGVFNSVCPNLVRDSVEIVVELLNYPAFSWREGIPAL
ncbi:MAG: C-GCAxxG-C-C family protein [Chloroflexota bacterium]